MRSRYRSSAPISLCRRVHNLLNFDVLSLSILLRPHRIGTGGLVIYHVAAKPDTAPLMACPLRLACRSTDDAVIARRAFFLLLSMCVCRDDKWRPRHRSRRRPKKPKWFYCLVAHLHNNRKIKIGHFFLPSPVKMAFFFDLRRKKNYLSWSIDWSLSRFMVISLLAIAPTWSESESVAKPLTIYPKSLVSSLFSRQYFLFRPLPLKRSEPLRFFFSFSRQLESRAITSTLSFPPPSNRP